MRRKPQGDEQLSMPPDSAVRLTDDDIRCLAPELRERAAEARSHRPQQPLTPLPGYHFVIVRGVLREEPDAVVHDEPATQEDVMTKIDEGTVIDKALRDITVARVWLSHRTADPAANVCMRALDALEREAQTVGRFLRAYNGGATEAEEVAQFVPPPPVVAAPTPAAPRPVAPPPVAAPPTLNAAQLARFAPATAAAWPGAAAPPPAAVHPASAGWPGAAPPAAAPPAAAPPAATPPAAVSSAAPPPPRRVEVEAPPLPQVSDELVEYFRVKGADGVTKPRAANEVMRSMLLIEDPSSPGICAYTDLEIAAVIKTIYPDMSQLVHRYPNEARGKLKKAGVTPFAPRPSTAERP